MLDADDDGDVQTRRGDASVAIAGVRVDLPVTPRGSRGRRRHPAARGDRSDRGLRSRAERRRRPRDARGAVRPAAAKEAREGRLKARSARRPAMSRVATQTHVIKGPCENEKSAIRLFLTHPVLRRHHDGIPRPPFVCARGLPRAQRVLVPVKRAPVSATPRNVAEHNALALAAPPRRDVVPVLVVVHDGREQRDERQEKHEPQGGASLPAPAVAVQRW